MIAETESVPLDEKYTVSFSEIPFRITKPNEIALIEAQKGEKWKRKTKQKEKGEGGRKSRKEMYQLKMPASGITDSMLSCVNSIMLQLHLASYHFKLPDLSK